MTTAMEFELDWIDEKLVVGRTFGPASVKGFEAMFEELIKQPGFGPGLRMLADHRQLDVSTLSVDDIEAIAELRARYASEIDMRSALVVGPDSPLRYGMARMFQAMATAGREVSIRIFSDYGEALSWLEDEAAGRAEPPSEGETDPL
jgi:hypothetical protein